MENLEIQLQQLFEKPVWTAEEHNFFLDLLNQHSLAELQFFFQTDFIRHLSQVTPDNKLHASVLLRQIHEKLQMPQIAEPVTLSAEPLTLHSVAENTFDQDVSERRRIFRRVPYWAAACLITLLAAGAYFWLRQPVHGPQAPIAVQQGFDVAPGRNKARLILADGSSIVLDSSHTGQLAVQGNARIFNHNGQLAYRGKGSSSGNVSLYNTVTTPRGGQYQLILPDGTKVWLNAASSLKYPTAFEGRERVVELTGEVFFEVAPDAVKPFVVKKGGTRVQVLGTSFNINAYDDESAINITLLQGRVNVYQGKMAQLLRPGEQAVVSDGIKLLRDIDTEEVVAWKEGKFLFAGKTDITTVMREIARWYDVEVEYRGTVSKHFWGTIPRDVPASAILKMLESTGGVHFKIEGKKVIVMP